MKKEIQKINTTLLDLFIGISIWGILCQLSIVWFVKEKLNFSTGLWIGIILALAAAYHMWWAIDKSLNFDRGGAEKTVRTHSFIRYAVILFMFCLVYYLKAGNVLSAFLGVMGLKVAAFIQPFTHKLSLKIQGK